jgi:hypothetical protein
MFDDNDENVGIIGVPDREKTFYYGWRYNVSGVGLPSDR